MQLALIHEVKGMKKVAAALTKVFDAFYTRDSGYGDMGL
jgi:hypothetical protein